MNKIVLLQNRDFTDKIFTEADLKKIQSMGDVIINDERKNPDAERAAQLLKDADIGITSWGCPVFDEKVLSSALSLKAVIHAAGSIKWMVTPEFWKRGIRISHASKALGKGVAETALGMTITSLKCMWQLAECSKNGKWADAAAKGKVRELYDITIGVIGAGYAGKHYINLLRNFDIDILLYDPCVSAEQAKEMNAEKVELEELLERSDVVSIHAPSIPSTYKMLNRERLRLMKDNAILINTARGAIIDEEDLVNELKAGRLFACLDVTDPEPPSNDNPLLKLPNVILTSHIAGAVNNGLHRIGRLTVDNLQRFIAGQEMDGEVKEEELNIIA